MSTTEKMPPVSEKCFHCTAACCSDVVLEIDEPEDFEDFDNIRWYLYHQNVFIYVDEGEWHLGFHTKCGAMAADHSCGVYMKRPEICREHSADDCSEYTGPGSDDHRSVYYDEHFDTADQLDAWLEKEDLHEMIRLADKETSVKFLSKLPKVVKKKR
jgi:hypothetical protein